MAPDRADTLTLVQLADLTREVTADNERAARSVMVADAAAELALVQAYAAAVRARAEGQPSPAVFVVDDLARAAGEWVRQAGGSADAIEIARRKIHEGAAAILGAP